MADGIQKGVEQKGELNNTLIADTSLILEHGEVSIIQSARSPRSVRKGNAGHMPAKSCAAATQEGQSRRGARARRGLRMRLIDCYR